MMEDRVKTQLQTAVGLFVSLLGSGLLLLVKENLPGWFFITFLTILCSVFFVVLVRFALGDLLKGLFAWAQKWFKHRKEEKLVKAWVENWKEMTEIVKEVLGVNGEPSEVQEKRFYGLHSWFNSNRVRVIRLWRIFQKVRTEDAYASEYEVYGSYSLGTLREIFGSHSEDPFSWFYAPMSIKLLKKELESKHWNDSDIRLALDKLGERGEEFLQWARYERG